MKQLKVGLDSELRELLEVECEKSGRRLGEEIRGRLWSSFAGPVLSEEHVRVKLQWAREFEKHSQWLTQNG